MNNHNIRMWRADRLPRPSHPHWLIEGIVPAAGATELFGPAGTGKSHIIGSILRSAALRLQKWYVWDMHLPGDRLAVWWITDELAEEEGAARLLSRIGGAESSNLRIVPAAGQALTSVGTISVQEDDYSYDDYKLILTNYGRRLIRQIKESNPALLAIDSATALVRGSTAPSQEIAITITAGLDRLSRSLGCPILITAHVSQESGSWTLARRLSYAARTGTAGVAAGYSTMIGTTKWQPGEYPNVASTLGVNTEKQAVICMSVAKQRDAAEMYDCHHPIVFCRHPVTGHFELVCDRADLPFRRPKQGKNKKGEENDPVIQEQAPAWVKAAYGDSHE